MSDRAKKFAEFTALTSLDGSDLFIVSDVSVNTTKKVTLTTLRGAVVRGPYANDSAANTGGVAVGHLYYTGAGDVKVRLA
jgi:hypothetical protein